LFPTLYCNHGSQHSKKKSTTHLTLSGDESLHFQSLIWFLTSECTIVNRNITRRYLSKK